MDSIENAILSHPLLNKITEDDRSVICEMIANGDFEVREYRIGECIDYGNGAALIVSGEADIEVSDVAGTILRTVQVGEIFGIGMMYAANQTQVTRAQARRDCTVVFIPKSVFDKMIALSSRIAINFISILSDKIAFLNRRIMTFTASDAEQKVALYLYNLTFGRDIENDPTITIYDTYTSIARKLNVGRASLYRILDKFVENGIIIRRGQDVTILKPDELAQIVKK